MSRRAHHTDILNSSESANIAVAGEVTVYSKAFKIAYGEYFSLRYKAVSASSTPSLKIELEVGVNDAPPTTEGAVDTNYIEQENATDIESALTTETWKAKSIGPVVSAWARLKITGNSGNPSDAILNAKLVRYE